MKWISSNAGVSSVSLMRAMNLVLNSGMQFCAFERGLLLLQFLIVDMGLNMWSCQNEFYETYRITLEKSSYSDLQPAVELVTKLLTLMADLGLSIQSLKSGYGTTFSNEFAVCLDKLKAKQFADWAALDLLKQGGSLSEIKKAVEDDVIEVSSLDRSGLRLIHLAAAYDRLDVLQWLVEARAASLEDTDAYGRNILKVAQVSKSVSCAEWIALRYAAE
jgi:hypothetical protein